MLTLIKVNPAAITDLITLVPEHLVGQVVWDLVESLNVIATTTGLPEQNEVPSFSEVVDNVVTSLLMSSNQTFLAELNPQTEMEKEEFSTFSEILTEVFSGLLISALDYNDNIDAALNIDLKAGEYYRWNVNEATGNIHIGIY